VTLGEAWGTALAERACRFGNQHSPIKAEVTSMGLTTQFLVNTAQRALKDGLLAAALSGGSVAARSKADSGSAVAGLNAPSHWVHGEEAVRREDVSASHTLLGAAIHTASAMLWAGLYEALQTRRERRTVSGALVDAAGVAALAAVVDLKLVPERLSPGFQHRMSRESLWLVYGSFALGLALGGLQRRQEAPRLADLRE
jgi:hypothetical protein